MKKNGKNRFFVDFSLRLRAIREALKMSQAAFSKEVEVSLPTYVRYEATLMMPKVHILSLLIEKFNVNVEWLLTGQGDMFKPKEDPSFQKGKKILIQDPRYIELLELMEIPIIEQSILVKLLEAKQIFKHLIEAMKKKKEHDS